MYGLHPRLVKSFPCIHKTCENGRNPSIVTYSLYHSIVHLPGDGLVVFKSGKILAHCFSGLLPGWRVSMCGDCVPGLSDLSHPHIRHVKYNMATHPWPLISHNTTHICICVALWFSDPARTGPPSWVVYVSWIEVIPKYGFSMHS